MLRAYAAPVSFGILALIVCAGLGGPLLSGARPQLLPVVVGEIVAGIVIGRTGFGWLNTTNDLTAHGVLAADITFHKKTKAEQTATQRKCLSVVQWDTSTGTWATRAPQTTCMQAQGFSYSLE